MAVIVKSRAKSHVALR